MNDQPKTGASDPAKPDDGALRRSVEQAVPPAERLPTGPDENPISERVREAGEQPLPDPDSATLQGGERVDQ